MKSSWIASLPRKSIQSIMLNLSRESQLHEDYQSLIIKIKTKPWRLIGNNYEHKNAIFLQEGLLKHLQALKNMFTFTFPRNHFVYCTLNKKSFAEYSQLQINGNNGEVSAEPTLQDLTERKHRIHKFELEMEVVVQLS